MGNHDGFMIPAIRLPFHHGGLGRLLASLWDCDLSREHESQELMRGAFLGSCFEQVPEGGAMDLSGAIFRYLIYYPNAVSMPDTEI